jgi:hypothetical protein
MISGHGVARGNAIARARCSITPSAQARSWRRDGVGKAKAGDGGSPTTTPRIGRRYRPIARLLRLINR